VTREKRVHRHGKPQTSIGWAAHGGETDGIVSARVGSIDVLVISPSPCRKIASFKDRFKMAAESFISASTIRSEMRDSLHIYTG